MKGKAILSGLLLALVSGVAMAEGGIDMTEVTAGIDDMETAIVTVGGALVGVAAVAVGFKWVKGMLFG